MWRTNVDKLELHGCLAENCEQNYFGGGKSASFPFVRSFRQSNKNSKGGMSILEFLGARGVKILRPPVVGHGYFLKTPNLLKVHMT